MLSMVTHSLAGVSMSSVSMAGKEEKEDLVFYDRLIGDGKAYIDTGILLTRQTYEIKAYITNESNALVFLYQNNGRHMAIQNYNSQWVNVFSPNNVVIGNVKNLPTTLVAKWDFEENKGYLNGVAKDIAWVDTRRDMSIIIGVRNANGAIGPFGSGCAYYYFKASLGGVENVHLRPCTYYGEAGMYDVVNKVFYGNANTEGSFSVAND